MRETFPAFNGLRFLAALCVLCFHYLLGAPAVRTLPVQAQNLLRSGPVALDFFFILSGFVLAHAYKERYPKDRTQRESFWIARVSRLYPVYLLAYCLFFPMALTKYILSGVPQGGIKFLLSGTLSVVALQAWTPLAQAWNGPSWSLSVEAFFYLLFPFICTRVLRCSIVKLLLTLVCFWLSMLLLCWLHISNLFSTTIWTGWIQNNPLFWTPTFVIGIAAYRALPWWKSLNRLMANGSVIGCVILLLLWCAKASAPTRELIINGGGVPLLVILVLGASRTDSYYSRLLGSRLLALLGGLSYIMYITQAPMWHLYQESWRYVQHGRPTSSVIQFCLFVVLLGGVSLILQKVVEIPAKYALERVFQGKIKRRLIGDPSDSGIEAV